MKKQTNKYPFMLDKLTSPFMLKLNIYVHTKENGIYILSVNHRFPLP